MYGEILARASGCFALGVACAMLLVGCGGDSRVLPVNHPASLSSSSSSDWELPDTLAELRALAPPDGVDAELWDELKGELASLLVASRAKAVSTPPSNAIDDLESPDYAHPSKPPYRFRWSSSFFRGDGNQNGMVNIGDITPVASHFNESVAGTPGAAVADYNRDGVVNIEDLSVLAANFGANVSQFDIELATACDNAELLGEDPFTPAVAVGWGEAVERNEFGFNVWEFSLSEIPNQASFWVQVAPTDSQGVQGPATPPVWIVVPWDVPFQVDDLAVDATVEAPEIGVTWTSAFFKGDGDYDGMVLMSDIPPLGMYLGKDTSELPNATVWDYDGSGMVNLGDEGVVYQYWGATCHHFVVEVSSAGSPGSYYEVGTVPYRSQFAAEINLYGFLVYRYTLPSPPERPFWVRVTPYDWWEVAGTASEPLEIGE